MVHGQAALGQHLFKIPVAQRVSQIPSHTQQDDLVFEVSPTEPADSFALVSPYQNRSRRLQQIRLADASHMTPAQRLASIVSLPTGKHVEPDPAEQESSLGTPPALQSMGWEQDGVKNGSQIADREMDEGDPMRLTLLAAVFLLGLIVYPFSRLGHILPTP